jgi:hypothetical protein
MLDSCNSKEYPENGVRRRLPERDPEIKTIKEGVPDYAKTDSGDLHGVAVGQPNCPTTVGFRIASGC